MGRRVLRRRVRRGETVQDLLARAEEIRRRAALNPLGRMTTPDDVAAARAEDAEDVAKELLGRDDLDGDDADPSMWMGVRYMPIENLSVQAGMLNNSNYGDDQEDWVFHVGAGYMFSFAQ